MLIQILEFISSLLSFSNLAISLRFKYWSVQFPQDWTKDMRDSVFVEKWDRFESDLF